MIRKLDESMNDMLGYKISETLTGNERDNMMDEIELAAEDVGKLNFILELKSLDEEPRLLFDDLKFSTRFHHRFARMAGIGDPKWRDWFTKLAGVFFLTETHFFESSQRDTAIKWARGEIATESLFHGDAVEAMRREI